jgi:hypothetical protein
MMSTGINDLTVVRPRVPAATGAAEVSGGRDIMAVAQITMRIPDASGGAIEASVCRTECEGLHLGLVTVELGATVVRTRARIAGEQFCKARPVAAGCDETAAVAEGDR